MIKMIIKKNNYNLAREDDLGQYEFEIAVEELFLGLFKQLGQVKFWCFCENEDKLLKEIYKEIKGKRKDFWVKNQVGWLEK
jgi:hypothetical protein